jgi:hypothetical protein
VNTDEIMALYDAEIGRGGSADSVIVRTVNAALDAAFSKPAAWLYESHIAGVSPALLLRRCPVVAGQQWDEIALYRKP